MSTRNRKSPALKALIRAVATLILTLNTSAALATEGAPTNPLDAQSQVAATLSVTRDAIGALLQRMSESRLTATLETADYPVKAARIQNLIRAATAKFETDLTHPRLGILSQLRSMMIRYNSTYESKQYPDSVKANLLAAQKKTLDAYAKNITAIYHHMIEELASAPGLSLSATQKSRNGSYTYYFLRKSCYSRACIDQSVMDETTYLSLVDDLFNRAISLSLIDGSIVRLEQYGSGYISDSGWFSGKLDSFPPEYRNLPMQISKAEFRGIESMGRRREVVFEQLLSQIEEKDAKGVRYVNQNGEGLDRFEEYFEIFCDTFKGRPELQRLTGGCLREFEADVLYEFYDTAAQKYACEIGEDQPGYCDQEGRIR